MNRCTDRKRKAAFWMLLLAFFFLGLTVGTDKPVVIVIGAAGLVAATIVAAVLVIRFDARL